MPTILEHKTVLDAGGITFIPKGSSQSQETDKVDDILDDVSSLNNVTFEEESKELLDNLNGELKIDKCIKELDYGSLAGRIKVVDNYPPLISSLLELISLHGDNLDGKTALVIGHPGIKDEISAEPGSQEYNSKYIGLGIFLTLTKKNATGRLMFENKNIDIKKEIDQTIKQMTDMNNSPGIIVNTSFDPSISNIILSNVTKDGNNACLSIDSMTKLNHESSSSHSSGHGDRKIIYIDLFSNCSQSSSNGYTMNDIQRIAPLIAVRNILSGNIL